MSRRDTLDLRGYFDHLLQAAGRVQRYVAGPDRAGLLTGELRQDAVLRNLQVSGEAAWNVQRHFPGFAAAHPQLPVKAMYGMRNVVAHACFRVDLDAAWEAASVALPEVAADVRALLESPDGPCSD